MDFLQVLSIKVGQINIKAYPLNNKRYFKPIKCAFLEFKDYLTPRI